jgi:alkylation response protein AidB-like acyl-CoA dehydrogenase
LSPGTNAGAGWDANTRGSTAVRCSGSERLTDLLEGAAQAKEDVEASLQLARDCGVWLPLPGGGHTQLRWSVLADVGEQNLTAARVIEPHVDALAILAEAGQDHDPGTAWGVFAAEAPGVRVQAELRGDSWCLTGTKPWCSLADRLDWALVTAFAGEERGLFRVDLRQDSVHVEDGGSWVARGLRTITSSPVNFDGARAEPVGGIGWYLTRPGFSWGAIGVAACWHGGARSLASFVWNSRQRGEIGAMHRGAVDAALHGGEVTLADAASRIDNGEASGHEGEILALRVRAVVAGAAEEILGHAAHALGPAPLAFDEVYSRQVADLQLYLRQHHAERDLAVLGALDGGEHK